MSGLLFDKDNPQKWLQDTRKLFEMWIYKAEIGGGTIKFDQKYTFRVPKTKAEKEFVDVPIQPRISYAANDLNSMYMMLSSAVRGYIKSK